MADRTSERSHSLVESHKGYDPRLLAFYGIVAVLLIVLVAGLARRQLVQSADYSDQEKKQNQRRILIPGPRGHIYDRDGRMLVGNRPRFGVTLYLDELTAEFRREAINVRKAYRSADDEDLGIEIAAGSSDPAATKALRDRVMPTKTQINQIARYTVVQRYLDQVGHILGRDDKVDGKKLEQHLRQQILLPFVLIDDLSAEEYARLIEQVPVNSPIQVYTSNTRSYPYGHLASHVLGYVSSTDDITAPEALSSGDYAGLSDSKTFKMRGTVGKVGLEASFDSTLQGTAGGSIYRVNPAGYRIDPPLEKRVPVQGQDITISLDIDLQEAATTKLLENELPGSAVAIDVNTGEVLVLASAPDYDLNLSAPRWRSDDYKKIDEAGGWLNRAVQGIYPPGSSFKILMTVAGMRSGWVTPDSTIDCPGYFMVGRSRFPCHDGHAHGHIDLATAIEKSCNVFFYKYGIDMGPQVIADEARRFHLDEPTGIELPSESTRMLVPDPAWKKRTRDASWTNGDTANLSIGQGWLQVSPLQMAAFTASLARRETTTRVTLLHEANRTPQRGQPLGLPPAFYAGLVKGMEQCTLTGTGHLLTDGKALKPALTAFRIAGKTGTAQKSGTDAEGNKGTINIAWFICFAPIEKPEIAIAVAVEGDAIGEETGGGRYAVPAAHAILAKWWEKKNRPAVTPPQIFSTSQR